MKELLLIGFDDFAGNATAINIANNTKALNVNVKIIPKYEYNKPVGSFLDDREFPAGHFLIDKIKLLTEEAQKKGPYTGPGLDDKYIIICNFDRNELDSIIKTLSESGVTKDHIKAVLTPVNSCFSVSELAAELSKEHKATRN